MHISCVVKMGMEAAIDGIIGVFRYRQIVDRLEMKLKNPVTALLFDAPLSAVVVVVVCCFSHSAYWLPTRKNYFTPWPIPLVVC